MDFGDTTCYFPCYEVESAARAFMVEQDPVAGVYAVRLPVVDHDPVRVHLRCRVRRSRIERGSLLLRNLLHLKEIS